MARKLRIQYPGAIYHVMNRGDRKEPSSSRMPIAAVSFARWRRPAKRQAGKFTAFVYHRQRGHVLSLDFAEKPPLFFGESPI
jgi:hypothetical protein